MSATEQPPASSPQSGPKRLAEDIYATAGDEMTCREAGRLIGQAADLLLSDAEAQARFPALFHHLQFCGDCTEEYRMVSGYARREAAGQLRHPPTIPPLPDEWRPSIIGQAGQLLRSVFTGFSLLTAQHALRGKSDRWQATVQLAADLLLLIESRRSSDDDGLRTLHFRLEGAELAGAADPYRGSLRLETAGQVEQEEMLDADSAASLREVAPGVYDLRLRINNQMYLVERFEIP